LGGIFLLLASECRSIIPYIKKFGKHPVTGAALKQEDLIPLTFHKNTDGELKTFATKNSLYLEPNETARAIVNSFDATCFLLLVFICVLFVQGSSSVLF
jgi:hypothetical protein